MERVIVNEGTKVNLFNLFKDLQDYTQLNSLRVLETLISTFGINVQTNLDGSISVLDTSLQVGPGAGGAGAGGYVTVEPGELLTGNLSWVSIASQVHVSTDGMSLGAHTLYLAQAYNYSDPVDVLSGFALSLAGGGQRNSRAHDTYVFRWDSNPTLSGAALATVTVGASSNTITADLRNTNVLLLKTAVLPPQAFAGNQASSAGAPIAPKNFRITNISASAVSTATDPNLISAASRNVARGLASQELAIDVAWNWDNVTWNPWSGQDQIVLVLNPGQQIVTTNELVNYHLWHPYGYDFLITAHNAGGGLAAGVPIIVTVTPYGTNTTHINSLPPVNNGGVIHSDASIYDILMTPVAQDGVSQLLTERYEDKVSAPIDGRNGPVILKTKLYPFVGERELIRIRSLGPLGQASVYTVMPAGLFTSSIFLSPVSYGSPFIAQMPFVSDNGANFKLTGKAGGFTVSISVPAIGGWKNADSFEAIWATDQTSLTFEALSGSPASSVVSSDLTFDVSVPTVTSSTTYFVKIRPLIGGIACSLGIPTDNSAQVTVGSAAGPVQPTLIITNPQPARTFSGTLLGPYTYSQYVKKGITLSQFNSGVLPVGVTTTYWLVSGLVSPAFSQSLSPTINTISRFTGQLMLTYSGLNLGDYYGIDNVWDALGISPIASSLPTAAIVLTYGPTSPAAGGFITSDIPYHDFIMGWDKASRILYTSTAFEGIGRDFIVTGVTITLNGLNGYDGIHKPVLRIYNASSNGEQYAGSVTIDPLVALNGQTAPMTIYFTTSTLTGANAPMPVPGGPGGRTIIVDLFNPNDVLGPSNAVGINWGNNGGIAITYKYIN